MENNIIQKVKFNNISIKIFKAEITKNVLLCVHGFGGDKESSVIFGLGEELTKYNFSVVAFNLRCHGENDNSKILNLNDCFDSFFTVLDFIKNDSDLKNKKISIFATSFGGFITLNCLSKTNLEFDKVILRAPAIFMDEVLINALLPFQNLTIEDLKEKTLNLGFENNLLIDYNFYLDLCKNNLEKNFNYKKKLFIIQGRQDNIVNPVKNESFYKNFIKNDDYKIFYIETADHRFKHSGELKKIIEISKSILI